MLTGIHEYRPVRDQRLKQFMHRMAISFAQAIGADPDVSTYPELVRALLFGPMAAASFRIEGPEPLAGATGILAEEAARFGTVPTPELTPEQIAEYPLSGSLFAANPGVRGIAEPKFTG